ncbi:hypothetical protein [Amycolatopsis sp. NPDC004378]
MTGMGQWRGWALVSGATVLAGGSGAAILWMAGPAAAAVGSVLAVAVFGIVGARGQAMLERRAAQQEALPDQVLSGRPRRVRDLDDPVLLRVHPAAPLRACISGQSADRVPPYVLRDCQRELWESVADGGFVLLVGDSTAGKTRAGYEAVRAVLADHVLLAPTTRESLGTVLPAVLAQRQCVVWLDDLERFLGADGLTAAMATRMLGDGDRDVLLLATMRTAEHDRYSAREQATAGAGREAWRAGREVSWNSRRSLRYAESGVKPSCSAPTTSNIARNIKTSTPPLPDDSSRYPAAVFSMTTCLTVRPSLRRQSAELRPDAPGSHEKIVEAPAYGRVTISLYLQPRPEIIIDHRSPGAKGSPSDMISSTM